MKRYRKFLNTLTAVIASLTLITLLPAVSWADSGSNTCTPPASSTPGVHFPTGASAGTYTYQCSGQYAGEWTNQYYVYDPSTTVYTPLYSPDYSYNCTTEKWTMTQYDYSPATGGYSADRITTSSPGLATNCPVPQSSGSTGTSTGGSGTANGSNGSNSISNTGPGSSNGSNTNLDNNTTVNNSNNLTLNNNNNGVSLSGNAIVNGNTTGGSAASGDVQNEQNIINSIQSSSGFVGNGTPVATFTDNVNGDVNGDLLIDPAALASSVQSTGPGSTNLDNTNVNNGLTVNNSTDASINNNINLAANSGNANVSGNTTAGNATSGNAENIANIVNEIDSNISSGQSFIGTININGNLNGNILLPADFVNQLLADNVPTVNITGPGSSNGSNTNVANNTTINNTNNLGENNNVTSSATSGNANVSGNTTAGNATSGNASTHLTAFNLTGSNVIGSNDLLVFVNVTGKWVGLILNAPNGTTAGEFGGGITSTGPGSTNGSNTNVNNNTTVNNNTNEKINNNIKTDASSGNASVTGNTKGGNATSGDAKNSVNLLNMENSTVNLSGWFGILFINVFGTWNGSLGVASNNTTSTNSSGGTTPVNGMAVFRFAPKSSGSTTGTGSGSSTYNNPTYNNPTSNNTNSNNIAAVLASVTKSGIGSAVAPKPQLSSSHSTISKTAITIGSLVVAYIVLDALYTNRAKVKAYVRTKTSK